MSYLGQTRSSRRPIHATVVARSTAVALFSILLAPAPAAFATDDANRLTLARAIESALARNPEVRVAATRLEAAKARETQAAAWPNPNLSVEAGEVPVLEPLAGTFKAGISQPLLPGGILEARTAAARLDREIATIDEGVVRRDLVARVQEGYADLLFARDEVKRARLAVEGAAATAKAIEARLRIGETAPVEALRAQVERSRAEREVSTADGSLGVAKGRLAILLGLDADGGLDIVDLGLPQDVPLPPPNRLIESGLANRAELRRSVLEVDREALGRRIAQASLWTGTEVSLGAGLSEGRPIIGSSLTVPLPFYRQQGEIREAEANRERARAEHEGLTQEITLEIQEAYSSAVSAARQVDLFRATYLPQADRLLDNAQRRLLAGEGSGIEVAEARRAQGDVSLQYGQALLDFRKALIKLERASGVQLLGK